MFSNKNYRLIASRFVDQMRLFLNETVKSPGITASVSRIFPPKFALIIIACLRVSNAVPKQYSFSGVVNRMK